MKESGARSMAPTKTKYNDHYYRASTQQLREHVEKTGAPCHLCGQPIDLSLPYTHPMSFTADHIDAIGTGGNLHGTILQAHRKCNSARGKRRLKSQINPPRTTIAW
nr:MAG TPA: restriction endonuclease [Caudoviricetes sp.]